MLANLLTTVPAKYPYMKIGYARVSTADQNLDMQRDALKRAGCEKILKKRRPARREASGQSWKPPSLISGQRISWSFGSSTA